MRKIISNILLVVGILLIFYPFIGKMINKFYQTKAISRYKEDVKTMTTHQKDEKMKVYQKYNKKGRSSLNLINTGDCLGYIDIPKINVYLPIYEGTNDEILLQGIGHLKGTSLPIGGINSNSVLVGHTGITAKTFFDNLEKMNLEDVFYIYVLGDILKYKVIDIKVVLPYDTQNIQEIEDKDLVTLLTCTPKYVNSHRLLVISERVELEEDDIDHNDEDI